MPLRASMFFNEEGVLARTERLVLRRPMDEDMMKYIDAFGGPNPLLANEYRLDERLQRMYWESVEKEDSLYCSICAKENGEFLGYCTIEELSGWPPEIGINLLERFQGRGIGPEAVSAFMDVCQRVMGSVPFIAKIEAENACSQKMFRRLGFRPEGIDTFIIKDPIDLERFEQKRLKELGGVPKKLQSLAKEFEVEPRKLLSHLLVFKRPAD